MQPGFFDVDHPTDPARVGLEQVTDDQFALITGFTYCSPDGSVHHVFSWNLPCSDLASIPRAFRWFEGRHGRHTLAALLHDHQVDPGPDDPGGTAYRRRRTLADDRFSEALGVLGVPRIRRLIMWSAVHFKTRLVDHGPGARVGWAAALAPVVGAALWVPWTQLGRYPDVGPWRMLGRRWLCGIVMGYGVILMLPTGLAVGAAEGIRSVADLGGWGPSPWPDDGDCAD
jgi:hypothetical protein